jgi:nucleoside-diphosphate-sugar epimerase/uncharacterized membrane protein
MASKPRPLVLITGAAGRIGLELGAHLARSYRVVGFDIVERGDAFPIIACDLSSDTSTEQAMAQLRKRFGGSIAAVVHLAAYFDFTGEENEKYRTVNVEGTARLLAGLQDFKVGRFIYTSTILVHRPGEPGETISEDSPIEPRWAYPKSKAEAEAVVAAQAGDIPYTILRLAGLYDEETAVPTLSQQIARIYERDLQSALFAGDVEAGQSLLHEADMLTAIERTIARRARLPKEGAVLIGEPGAVSYRRLQDLIGAEIHGQERWTTIALPKPLAKAGAAIQQTAEPIVPDSIDQGEAPFVRPFMIEMADDHYALDISRADEWLGWRPKHKIEDTLPALIENLKADPVRWYKANKIVPPAWMQSIKDRDAGPEEVRAGHDEHLREEHQQWLWAHFANLGLGLWLLAGPATLGYDDTAMSLSDWGSGLLLLVFAALSLDWRFPLMRYGAGLVGLWLLFAPLVFWTPSAAAYLNGTLVGALVIGFATIARPVPLLSPAASQTGPDIPKGWVQSPSTYLQRTPIIALAVVGFLISRYLTAYQLGHIDGVWEPFFGGDPADPLNGTEEIITSEISRAWPVPDAGVGALTYMLEILTGLIGSQRRWRTMPWLVLIFGLMIVPLGIVSITFIIIQPILLGTWCTLCLFAAAAMALQIPFSVDELIATGQFLERRRKAGRLTSAFLFGDTDEGEGIDRDNFERPLGDIIRDLGVGLGFPWTLIASIGIGIWLMFTRLTLGTTGDMANADHLIGALVVVVAVTALAEVTRAARFLNLALGGALLITPFMLGATLVQMVAGIVTGLLIMALSVPRGEIKLRFGSWDRYVV